MEGGVKRKHGGGTSTNKTIAVKKKENIVHDSCGRCSKMLREKDMTLMCGIYEIWFRAKCIRTP